MTGIRIAGLPNSPSSIGKYFNQMQRPTGYPSSGLNESVIKQSKANGGEPIAGGFFLRNKREARLKNGLWHWKSGVFGETCWTYYSPAGDPYNDLDGGNMDWCFTMPPLPGETEWNPIIPWECYREGVDDYKYIYTLQTLIKAAPAGKKTIAGEAQRVLDSMSASVSVNSLSSWSRNCDLSKVEKFRRQVAEFILKLQ